MFDLVLRKLARDQWVRMHGTPRVTVLVGGSDGREIWEQWVALSGLTGALLEGDLDAQVRDAVARAVADPAQPIAVRVDAAAAAAWRLDRSDRLAAMVDEGWIDVDADHAADRPGPQPSPLEPVLPSAPSANDRADRGRGDVEGRRRGSAAHVDARSVAEATLFEALEGTPATAGRFALNESLSVRFGGAAAEIDLLSRRDGIAIEIDGVHHFADLEAYRRDRKKDLLLQAQGLFVVRVLADDVMRDARAAVNAVCQALAYRWKERG